MLKYTFLVNLLLSCELPYDSVDKNTTGDNSVSASHSATTGDNPTSASLSAAITFVKDYGSPETEEHTHAVIQTFDGGYALLGLFRGHEAFYLVKTDRYGNLQWEKKLEGYVGDGNGGQDLRQTPDSGFIVAGNSELLALVIKTDKSGTFQWVWYGPRNSQAQSIALSGDNGYVAVGYTYGDATRTITAFKLSNVGNLLWTRMYLTENYSIGNSIERTSDNGFIIAGTASVNGNQDICLFKIGSQGNLQWNTFWGGAYDDEGNQAIQTADGGYAVVGTDGKENNSQIYLVKTDSRGRYQWIKGYFPSSSASGNNIVQTSDRGFAIAGSAYGQPLLLKVSSNGSHQWNKEITVLNMAEDIAATSDGGYALTGLLIEQGDWQGSLIKTDRYGNY